MKNKEFYTAQELADKLQLNIIGNFKMTTKAIKHIPMPFVNESDEAYDKRLNDLGITDEDFDAAFNAEMPESDFDTTDATYSDAEGDEGSDELSNQK